MIEIATLIVLALGANVLMEGREGERRSRREGTSSHPEFLTRIRIWLAMTEPCVADASAVQQATGQRASRENAGTQGRATERECRGRTGDFFGNPSKSRRGPRDSRVTTARVVFFFFFFFGQGGALGIGRPTTTTTKNCHCAMALWALTSSHCHPRPARVDRARTSPFVLLAEKKIILMESFG